MLAPGDILKNPTIGTKTDTTPDRQCPECSAMGMWQFPICKLKWDLLRTSVTSYKIDKNTFSAPFRIFYVRTEV